MLLLMLYSKSLNETGLMFRWGKFELRRSLVSVSNKIKTMENHLCVCKCSRSFSGSAKFIKATYLWNFSQFCRRLVHSLLSWIFTWYRRSLFWSGIVETLFRKSNKNAAKGLRSQEKLLRNIFLKSL